MDALARVKAAGSAMAWRVDKTAGSLLLGAGRTPWVKTPSWAEVERPEDKSSGYLEAGAASVGPSVAAVGRGSWLEASWMV
jgi:hypothetical protein